jgi:hypothetical protein
MSLFILILVFTVTNFVIAGNFKQDLFIDILKIDGLPLKVISRISLIPPIAILILVGLVICVVSVSIYEYVIQTIKDVW